MTSSEANIEASPYLGPFVYRGVEYSLPSEFIPAAFGEYIDSLSLTQGASQAAILLLTEMPHDTWLARSHCKDMWGERLGKSFDPFLTASRGAMMEDGVIVLNGAKTRQARFMILSEPLASKGVIKPDVPSSSEPSILSRSQRSYLKFNGRKVPRIDQRAMERELCATAETSLFFDDDVTIEQIAKTICGHCMFIEPCLERALGDPDLAGVWGGQNEQERRRIIAERQKLKISSQFLDLQDTSRRSGV